MNKAGTELDAENAYSSGRMAFERREYELAVQKLSQAVTSRGDFAEYQIWLGAALSLADRAEEAMGHLETACAQAPQRIDAARHLAWVYTNRIDRPAAAIERFRSVIERAPSLIDDYTGMCHKAGCRGAGHPFEGLAHSSSLLYRATIGDSCKCLIFLASPRGFEPVLPP